MSQAARGLTGRPLPVQAPSAFVRIRPRRFKCGQTVPGSSSCRARTYRLPRQ